MKKILVVLFLLGMFILSGCSQGSTIADAAPSGTVGGLVGDIAPDFSITDVGGDTYSLSQFKGRYVLVAAFATWCTPCQIEANNAKQVDDALGGNKFEIFQIGVDNKENIDDLKQFKEQFGNDDWIVGFDDGSITRLYNIRSLDTTVLVNPDGVIVYRDNGVPIDTKTLESLIQQ